MQQALRRDVALRMALAVATAVLVPLSFPPWNQGYLAWLALVPLLCACRGASPGFAFMLGWGAQFGITVLGFHWIGNLVLNYTSFGVLGAVLVVFLAGLLQGLAMGCWMATVAFLRCRPVFYAFVFVAFEHFCPMLFPWYLANSQHECVLLSQVLDLLGPGGLSLAILAFNVAVWKGLDRLFLRERLDRLGVGFGIAALFFCALYGAVRLPQVEANQASAQRVRVAVIQPCFWIGKLDIYNRLLNVQNLALAAVKVPTDLLVLPETVIKTAPTLHSRAAIGATPVAEVTPDLSRRNYYPRDLTYLQPSLSVPAGTVLADQNRGDVWSRLAVQRAHKVPTLFGTLSLDLTPNAPGPVPGKQPLYNSAFLLDEKGVVQGRADKNELLAFGEYIPLGSVFPSLYKLIPFTGVLMAGTQPAVLNLHGHHLGLSICYEDILPDFHLRMAALQQPNVLVNLSNDAWFGRTDEPEQHFAIAKARCIEHRLCMIRASNIGVSAVVDATGRVLARTDFGEAQVLHCDVPMLPGGSLYTHVGNLLPWGCLLGVIVGVWRRTLQSRLPSV